MLIVDDEPGMRDMLRWSLAGSAYEIVAAGGVALVVTDMTMPRLGGFDVLVAAAATRPRTPVIVMTG